MKKTSLFCAAFVLALAGCGQKGPLYLPQPEKPKAAKPAPVPATTSVPAAATTSVPETKSESTSN